VIKQRLDIPSSNFYSALPILSKVGLIAVDLPPSIARRSVAGPVFGLGESGSGVTALATAMSMLGFRCCSDLEELPNEERRSLLDGAGTRVFDAYVNIGSLDEPTVARLAETYPKSRIIVAAATAGAANGATLQDLLGPSRVLILPADHHDRWHLLSEFLGCDYPSHRYPQSPDQPRRAIQGPTAQREERPSTTNSALGWDSLPWIVDSANWCGVRLAKNESPGREGTPTTFDMGEDRHWLLRNDTFPGNLALFDPRNVTRMENDVARLALCRASTAVRDFTSAAISSRSLYRYGRFTAGMMPAKVPGLITGMFLHRNSPRQEIDIEFVGNDTTRMLVNVYFNPGEDGARLEHGYRGTPVAIDLGFDASAAFHRYEIDWTPERIRWLVDGECVCLREHWHPTPVPHLPMQFHLNLWHSNSAALAGRLAGHNLPAYAYLRDVLVAGTDLPTPASERR
jgi:hypothetical protein